MQGIDPFLLRRLPLFAELDDAQLARVMDSAHPRHLDRGERLFTQGDPARCFFLVRDGAIKLFLLSRDGTEKVIEVLRDGDLFAEAVMFMDGHRYPVSAEALAATELLAFDNAVFLELLHESPDLAFKALGALSRRMHGLLQEIDELTLHNATWRLVVWLLAEAERDGSDGAFTLAIPKQVIASRLSIKPETLSRIFARLRDDGLIRVEGERLEIRDRAGLQKLLEF